jgi:hypothetical protein
LTQIKMSGYPAFLAMLAAWRRRENNQGSRSPTDSFLTQIKDGRSSLADHTFRWTTLKVIMRMCAFVPTFFAIFIGIATLPAAACELKRATALHPTVMAFLAGHSRATASTPLPRLVACKADGAACAADAECCSGACKPIGEGRACVAK